MKSAFQCSYSSDVSGSFESISSVRLLEQHFSCEQALSHYIQNQGQIVTQPYGPGYQPFHRPFQPNKE